MRIFLFILIGLLSVSPVFAQSVCDGEGVADEVSSLFQQTGSDSQKVAAVKQVELGVIKGLIRPDHKEDLVKSILEYSVRISHRCDIPDTLKGKVSSAIAIAKSGGSVCDVSHFSKTVERQHRALAESQGYELFEEAVHQQISSNVIASVADVFDKRWEADPTFRARVVKAGLEINIMYVNNCVNLQDPILNVIDYF